MFESCTIRGFRVTADYQCEQNNDPLIRGPVTIKNENEAYCDRIDSKRDSDKFWCLFRHEEGILGRFEVGCFPAYIQLASGLSCPCFNIDADSFAPLAGRRQLAQILGWYVPR